MTLRISGKNMDIGDALRTHVKGKVADAIGKYFDGGFGGHVTVEKEGAGYRTECRLHLDTGVVLQSEGGAMEPYPAVDQAVERIEKRLRRYKRKLKDHAGAARGKEIAAVEVPYAVIEALSEEEPVPEDYAPLVIAETTTTMKTLSVERAVMELDLSGAPVVVFRHAVHGGVNIVYRRSDGNIGWVDPALAGQKPS